MNWKENCGYQLHRDFISLSIYFFHHDLTLIDQSYHDNRIAEICLQVKNVPFITITIGKYEFAEAYFFRAKRLGN